MSQRLLFLTGSLAKPRLEKVLAGIGFGEDVTWRIADMNVKVAALMPEALIRRRLPQPVDADRVIIPGRCRADIEALSAHFGVKFERGPEELQDLPEYFGKGGVQADLSRYDIRIFAEIVDAPQTSVDAIVARALKHQRAGADVIDLGCLPETPFPHLADAVKALKAAGLLVSVDSASEDELLQGGRAGADFLLSLHEHNLWIAEDTGATPVLIPRPHGDLPSLIRAHDAAVAKGLACLCDPVLDPIHFGFATSLLRYAEFRRQRPEAEMLMGTGNLTELTDADSGGIAAVLLGVCSELAICNVLTVQVSPHTRRTIEEHDTARRIMFAAREDQSLPRDYSHALLSLHERKPFPYGGEEIAAVAAQVRDDNYRIDVAEDGIHVYSRRGHWVEADPYAFFQRLDVADDGRHAFYLGVELARAEIAHKLGKRFAQDMPLKWGCAVDEAAEDLTKPKAAGVTLEPQRHRTKTAE